MLQIRLPAEEGWDAEAEVFITLPEVALSLEHSLVSLSKWEAIWHKHFLGRDDLSPEEIVSYIKCMSDESIDDCVIARFRQDDFEAISEYIKEQRTGTKITDRSNRSGSSQFVTSELIYGWMVGCQIPFHPAETWHLSRLLTLIRVCQIQQDPKPSKMNQNDWIAERNRLNAQRLAARRKHG